jgi:hypothetical protein
LSTYANRTRYWRPAPLRALSGAASRVSPGIRCFCRELCRDKSAATLR